MKRLFNFLLVAFVFLLTVLPREVLAELPVRNVSPWNSDERFVGYELPDDDHFDFGGSIDSPYSDFEYTKYGNLQSEDTKYIWESDFKLSYTPLTAKTQDLFMLYSKDNLLRMGFPEETDYGVLDNTGSSDYIVKFDDYGSHRALFRYYKFRNEIYNYQKGKNLNIYDDNKARKYIVLIHGWNPTSKVNHLNEEFDKLADNIGVRMFVADKWDWNVLGYHWEDDADTGPVIAAGENSDIFLQNATEAAIAGHMHGQHLGELLKAYQPNIEKIHLIAHSAGAWAARSAAKHILKRQPNIQVQITLLDPFIPDQLPSIDSPLSSIQMGSLPFLGNGLTNGSEIKLTENYYAEDINTDGFGSATSQIFNWSGAGIQKKIDYVNFSLDGLQIYSSHDGPVQFYADTIQGLRSSGPPTRLSNAQYYKDGENLGWPQSMFEREVNSPPKPSIVSSPSRLFTRYA